MKACVHDTMAQRHKLSLCEGSRLFKEQRAYSMTLERSQLENVSLEWGQRRSVTLGTVYRCFAK
jgi:hypothetical protein